MNSDTKARFVGLVGLGSIAVWLTLSLGSCFYLSLASLRWPVVPVRVVSSEVTTGVSIIGFWWEPEVQYEYQLNGRTFRSNNVRYLMPVFHQEEGARVIQTTYPRGASTRAAYDPHNPLRSVLEPGVPANMWKQALIPLFFWVLTGYLYYEINHPERRFLVRSGPELVPEE